MDVKKVAVIIGIAVLLPLFLGLFVDALYSAPKWEDYCNNSMYTAPYKEPIAPSVNCTDFYSEKESQQCITERGNPISKYDTNNCPVFDKCDYCQKYFSDAEQSYNRTIFFILAPIGLIIVIIGIYLIIDYLGAGLMFAGLITMFYATVRSFSELSKLLRAIIILFELLIIIWIAYKKIENNNINKRKNIKR